MKTLSRILFSAILAMDLGMGIAGTVRAQSSTDSSMGAKASKAAAAVGEKRREEFIPGWREAPPFARCFHESRWRIIKYRLGCTPTAILRVNLPNSITLIRICMIPLLMWVLSTSRLSSANGEKEILASALFIAASITDGIDGYIARRRGQITTMGILLDPLADKLLIAAAFITLVQFNPRLVPAWIAVVIIGREFLVSGLRAIAAAQPGVPG